MFIKILDIVSENMMYKISAILFAIATCYILKTLLKCSVKLYNLWRKSRNLPGPSGLPLLGNIIDVIGDTENLLKKFVNWAESYPSPSRIWFVHKLFIIHRDPDSIKELLQNQKVIEKSEIYALGKALAGNGLVTAPVKEWRVHRKLINTVFKSRVLPSYGTFLAEKAQGMIKQMEVELHGKEFEIHHYLAQCTLRMIFGVLLGPSLTFETEEIKNYLKDVYRFLEISSYRSPRGWLHPNIIFNYTSLGQEFNTTVKRISTTTEKVFQKAYLAHAEGRLSADKNYTTASGTTNGETVPGVFMNLPRDRDDFTDQDFLDELITMILAGFHTLSIQMDFVARMLTYNPDIQDKVYEELYSIYGCEDPADRPVEIDDLPRLEYLERVIHETMRIFPPVGFFERGITEDVDIGSCVLPAGCTSHIMIINLHRNEKYWPNPLKFDPDRFLAENVAKRPPCTYIPFGTGPRNCIGGKYAIMAPKILLATLFRRYILRVDTVVPVENIRFRASVALECVEPWKLRIEDRNPGKIKSNRKIH